MTERKLMYVVMVVVPNPRPEFSSKEDLSLLCMNCEMQ